MCPCRGRAVERGWNAPTLVIGFRRSQRVEFLPPSSSGLGHHPFKVAARVRIPLGVRNTTSRSRGEVWSSRRPVKPEVAGSSPVGTATGPPQGGPVHISPGGSPARPDGRVAQLAEHTPEKRGVRGSTPRSTTEKAPGRSVGLSVDLWFSAKWSAYLSAFCPHASQRVRLTWWRSDHLIPREHPPAHPAPTTFGVGYGED